MFGRIASAAGSVVPSRRSLVRALIAVGVLVAALLCAMVAAPLILNGDATKEAIERQLTTLTGGDFRYATLDLRMLPRPTADMRQVTFRVASVVDGTADRIALRFAVLPLLKGNVRISTMHLERPALVVRMPVVDSAPIPDDPVAVYRSAINPALQWLALNARGLKLSARDGAVDLRVEGVAPFKLDALSLDVDVASDAIEAKVTAHADFWKRAEVHARIATESLAASLELTFNGLEAAPALERALGASPVRFLPGATEMTFAAQTDGLRSITGKLSLAVPSLIIARNGARLDIGASHARVNVSYAPGDSVVSFEDVTLGVLLTGGAGTLSVRPGTGGTVLEATAARVDAGRVRAGAIAIAEDLPRVRALAAIVKDGIALDVHVGAAADDMKVLADMSVYDVSLRAEGATIDVPVPPMELTRATGSVRIAKQVLSVGDVAATFGGSRLRNGEMTLALGPQVALRALSAAVDLDLAENHLRAAYLLRNTPIAPELDRILSIAGRAKGTLALREEGRRYRGIYDLTSVTGTLRHAGVPLPIAIDGGALRFDTGGDLVLRKVAGSIGASRVEAFDAELAFVPGAAIRNATGTASLNLDELAPWLLALPAATALRGEISAVQGGVDLKLSRVAGALTTPLNWQISAVLTPRKVRMASPHLPDPLTIDGGTLRLEDKDLVCDGVGVEMQDARGVVSGPVRAYAAPARSIDVSIVRATIGARSLKWIEDEARIPPGVRLQAPLALERARIRWPMPAPWPLEIAAAGSLKNGARAELDLRSRPEGIQIRRLTLKDQDSDVRIGFDWQPERAVLAFHGVLSGRSVGRVLAMPIAASGTLRGDFDATVDFREPARSRATGNLEGVDVALPVAFDVPVTIDRVALDADGERVRVRDALLHIADEPLRVAGTIAHTGAGFEVDADVVAEGIDARGWLARLGSRSAASERASLWRGPLRGRLAVRARHVDILGYRLEPFAASVALLDRKVTAEITEARLCGISVPYTLVATEGTIDLKGRAMAKELPLATAATCLSKDSIRASGTMDLTADFTASGAPSALLASSRGTAKLRARDGRVAGARALSGVLEIDEVNQRLPKADVDSSRDGFSYSAIEIDAKLAGDRVIVERALLESAALNVVMQGEVRLDDGQVALTGIALPIVNAILRNVPIIGAAIGAPIVGIPIRVSGDIKDPHVDRIAATAIAGALLTTLQSVVSLPVQLLGAGTAASPAPDPR